MSGTYIEAAGNIDSAMSRGKKWRFSTCNVTVGRSGVWVTADSPSRLTAVRAALTAGGCTIVSESPVTDERLTEDGYRLKTAGGVVTI